jgi:hypothetical protein
LKHDGLTLKALIDAVLERKTLLFPEQARIKENGQCGNRGSEPVARHHDRDECAERPDEF